MTKCPSCGNDPCDGAWETCKLLGLTSTEVAALPAPQRDKAETIRDIHRGREMPGPSGDEHPLSSLEMVGFAQPEAAPIARSDRPPAYDTFGLKGFTATQLRPKPPVVVGLHGPGIAELLGQVTDANDRNALTALMIVGLDGEATPVVGMSHMTRERAFWLADHLMQYARTL